MTVDRQLARQRLDERFDRVRTAGTLARPHRGWVRAVRDALGMTSAEMAHRMGVSQQRVGQIERNEVDDRIQLGTLRQAAAALDCELVYVLLPRTSLGEAATNQAQRRAAEIVGQVSHHSRLEDQSLTESELDRQLDELAARLIDKRGLWSTTAST